LTALGGWLHPRLRRVELELPDVLGEAEPATVTSTAPGAGQPATMNSISDIFLS